LQAEARKQQLHENELYGALEKLEIKMRSMEQSIFQMTVRDVAAGFVVGGIGPMGSLLHLPKPALMTPPPHSTPRMVVFFFFFFLTSLILHSTPRQISAFRSSISSCRSSAMRQWSTEWVGIGSLTPPNPVVTGFAQEFIKTKEREADYQPMLNEITNLCETLNEECKKAAKL